ncbi:MAG: tetratricopeptide repeat protein [Candidatus Micrarchaeia archaeon]|jgi:tetratricopeptide (TPR) repeat protein
MSRRTLAHASFGVNDRREREGMASDSWKPRAERPMHERLKPVFKLVEAKRYREAKERVADILERDPEHKVALSMLIMLHGRLGEIGYAEQMFRDAVSTGIVTREIYGGMVDAYARCGMFDEARGTIAEAAGRGMDCVHNHSNLMSGLYARGKYDEMVALYVDIPQKYRMTPSVTLKYAEALRKLGHYERAIETAAVTVGMHATLDERTKAAMIMAYSEMCRGNPQKAYEMLDEVYGRVSQRWDRGFNLRFFPRLLCGMVFACSRGGIPQPESTLRHWKGMLGSIKREGRGKNYDVINAITQVDEIPVANARQAVI